MRALRLEAVLWVVGLGCAGWCLLTYAQARASLVQAQQLRGPVQAEAAVPRAAAAGEVMGHLEIPAIGLSVAILEDDETKSLLQGVGHIRGTALPGGLGTVGLAGHRDTFLRPLRRIVPRMQLNVTGAAGTYHYLVDSTEVVAPEAVEVLDIRDRPELVLITCYPFNYVGAAPMRFIVHAHLVSLDPDPA